MQSTIAPETKCVRPRRTTEPHADLLAAVALHEAALAQCAEFDAAGALVLWRKAHGPASVGETVRRAVDAGRVDVALRVLDAVVPFALLARHDSPAWRAIASESAWARRHIASQLSLVRKPSRVWDAIAQWEAGGGGAERTMLRFHLVAFVGAVVRVTDQRLTRHVWRAASPTLRAHVLEISIHHVDHTLDLANSAECQRAWSDVAEASEAVDAEASKRKRKALPGMQALIRGAIGSIRNLALWAAHNDATMPEPEDRIKGQQTKKRAAVV